MEKRLNIAKADPEALKVMLAFEKYSGDSRLTTTHKYLIKIRASQINGCAYCINMHTKDARAAGETEQRIYLLNAWKETSLYTEEERAILALTEEMTLIQDHVSDETYKKAASLFDEGYLALVIMAVTVINAWNRVVITTRPEIEG